jgi:ornithine decarboxylase
MDHFNNARDAIVALRPDVPLALNRPHAVRTAARWFLDAFEGEVLYAVKANPSPWVLDSLWAEGVRHFDVASIVECALIHDRFPEATLAFMHPVKSRAAIARAYHDYGCRIFALDSMGELEKILQETNFARDLTLIVRLAVSNADASLKLEAKFGTSGEEAIELLRAARAATEENFGISFHVGSQCMNPSAWRYAMRDAAEVIVKAGVTLDVLDIGGGFPSIYPDMSPPPMSVFLDEIHRVFDTMPVTMNCRLWAEPGRALVAEATSIAVKVDLRKGDALYLNDGAYGNLFDATHVDWRYPMTPVRVDGHLQSRMQGFSFFGPTCDSLDAAKGPFQLPADMEEGDYIEIGMLGAYGVAMATRFNGYGQTQEVIVHDQPFASMFPAEEARGLVLPLERRC